ncbi:MAG: DAK2 domain-containing protein, partial [Chloroflexi bacterium]|nr:DAK2 domain-containing protein [Chloroflexota bacterium]
MGPPTEARTSTAACNSQCFIDALRSAGAWLDVNVDLVNALNVFPVPDGDTGTNMSLTMRAALAELDSNTYTAVSQVARVVAEGALMGAR